MERGSIVVCINDDWALIDGHIPFNGAPKKNNIYTIRDIYVDSGNGLIGVRLEEIRCSINPNNGLEFGFDILAFMEVLSITEYNQDEINNLIKEPQY